MFQVPDYMLFYENCEEEIKPLLIEVKSVKGEKITLKVKKNQYVICEKYSDILNIELLYAIYWGKYKVWTLNCINNFQEKNSEYKIRLEDALKNDLSVIIGDYSILVNRIIYRKSEFCKWKCVKFRNEHELYGYCISDELSVDGKNYHYINYIESVIIDSFIDFAEEKVVKQSNKIILYETSQKSYIVKVSNLILRCLAKVHMELTSQNALLLRKNIVNLAKRFELSISYSIPVNKNSATDKLFEDAFKESFVIDRYNDSKQ